MRNDEKIFRSFDVFAFTICSTFGVGLVLLPFVSGEEIRSAWLKVLVGVIPYLILIYLLNQFVKKYESQNLLLETKHQFPKLIFYSITVYMIGSTIYNGMVIIKGMGTVVETYLLPETPHWIIIGSFLSVVAISTYYGVAAITRFVVLLVIFDMLILLLLVVMMFGDYFRWIYIPPVIMVDPITLLKSTLSDTIRYAGVFALIAYVSHVKEKEKIIRPMSYGLIFVMVTYVVLSLLAVGTFGFEESISLVSPFIALVQTFGGEAGGLERVDLIFVSFWIIAFYKMIMIHVWFMVYAARIAFPNVQPMIWTVVFNGLLFLTIITSTDFTSKPWRFYNVNTFIYTFILPTVLICYFLWTRKQQGGTSHEA